jgi:hypothetical protein
MVARTQVSCAQNTCVLAIKDGEYYVAGSRFSIKAVGVAQLAYDFTFAILMDL